MHEGARRTVGTLLIVQKIEYSRIFDFRTEVRRSARKGGLWGHVEVSIDEEIAVRRSTRVESVAKRCENWRG